MHPPALAVRGVLRLPALGRAITTTMGTTTRTTIPTATTKDGVQCCRTTHTGSNVPSSTAGRTLRTRPTTSTVATGRTHLGQTQRRAKSMWKSSEEAKSRFHFGPFSWKAGLVFLAAGCGLVYFFEAEKARMKRERMAGKDKGMGRPRVGGPFELVDMEGNKFTQEDLKGNFSLIYFGFTHCPDICPEELEKIATAYTLVNNAMPSRLVPIFITCDPARDTPAILSSYLKEFSPDFVGLTGTHEQVKRACKAFRVYFSTPEDVKPGEDYLVDHSVYFYLMSPEGEFVEVLGRQHSPEGAAGVIVGHMGDWRGGWGKEVRRRGEGSGA